MSAVGRVMAAVRGTAVIGDRVQTVATVGDVVGRVTSHVQTLQRKVHHH